MKKVLFKKLRTNAQAPVYQTAGSAGADLHACIESELEIDVGQTVLVPTGISIELPEGTAGFIMARSGLATKKGLAPANKVGVIDADYRGEIIVALLNHSTYSQRIAPGERIAQLLIMPVFQVDFIESALLNDTQRGSGGFGSTGLQ